MAKRICQKRHLSSRAASLPLVVGLILDPVGCSAGPSSGPAEVVRLAFAADGQIDPGLYGINYDWNAVPAAEYPLYADRLHAVAHFTLQRYPAGWNAEHYDWNSNSEVDWRKAPESPGADAREVGKTSAPITFITPSTDAVSDPAMGVEEVDRTIAIVKQFGGQTRVWEIGNEWWLQSGAKKDEATRAAHRASYARLVRAVVPELIKTRPEAEIYVGGDWLRPEDFSAIRAIVGDDVWRQVKGVSLHIYCGTNHTQTDCTHIPQQVRAIEAASGKSSIYASEWNVPRRYTQNNFGMPHANEVGIAMGLMAASGIKLAAYWPVVRILPSLAFVSSDFRRPQATGVLFGWLSQGFRGSIVRAFGAMPAIAAVDGSSLNVFVFSRDRRRHVVDVELPNSATFATASAQVLYGSAPDGSGDPHTADLPLQITDASAGRKVRFVLNPATPARGSGWEIAHLSFSLAKS